MTKYVDWTTDLKEQVFWLKMELAKNSIRVLKETIKEHCMITTVEAAVAVFALKKRKTRS